MMKLPEIANCQNITRRHDPDRYLVSLMMPRRARAALWVLYALNFEIAKTREIVTDTTIGLIRLQWWRDAIGEIYEAKEPRAHEVVTPLAKIIAQYDLPKEPFEALIYAREFDLEGVAPATVEGLLNYCEYVNNPLNTLCLKVLGYNDNKRIVNQVSRYYGLIGAIRAVPYMLKYGQVLLPQDLMAAQGITAQKIIDFNKKAEIIEVIKELLGQVQTLQNQFRNDDMLITSPYLRRLKQLSDHYAAKLAKFDGDVFNPAFHRPEPLLPLKLWFKAKK